MSEYPNNFNDEEGSVGPDETLLPHEKRKGVNSRIASVARKWVFVRGNFISIGLHLLFAASWLLYSASWRNISCHAWNQNGLLPFEFAGAAEAVEYETKILDLRPAPDDYPEGLYEGAPSTENDIMWFGLMNVGWYSLSDYEEVYLQSNTSRLNESDSASPHLIDISVFHQLHCLNSLRKLAYGLNELGNTTHFHGHIGHCIAFLRQVLMCHADLTPIYYRPDGGATESELSRPPQNRPWRPYNKVQHTCRKWDKIHEWAARANTSGLVYEPHPGYRHPQMERLKKAHMNEN